MAIQQWRIETPIQHDLRLEHGWFWGDAKFFVDEKVVFERPVTLVDFGFHQEIIIDETTYGVSVRPRGIGFIYSFGPSDDVAPLGATVTIRQKLPKWFRGLEVIALVVAVVSIWAIMASAERARLTPKSNDMNLKEFAATMPPPRKLAIIDDDGSSKVVWIGETAMWSLPSGPACYVFNASGKLVEWNTSTGDGEATTRFSRRTWDQKQLTIGQALEFIDGVDDN